jgi:streptogramin lyase
MFLSWLYKGKKALTRDTRQRRPQPARPRTRYRPWLECLEERWVPSTVTNLNDSGPGSLRDAISNTPAGGTVDFQPGLSGTITLASQLTIENSITIAGPGPSTIAISANPGVSLDMFALLARVDISGLQFTSREVNDPMFDDAFVGNRGELTLDACLFVNNSWGAVSNYGTMNINNCTFENNSAGFGGAVFNAGKMQVLNSTFFGNSASEFGGAIFNESELDVADCTITGNHAPKSLPDFGGGGAGITNAIQKSSVNAEADYTAFTFLSNTIVAGNSDDNSLPDCSGRFISGGHNLIGADHASDWDPTDQVGIADSPLDPRLEPLNYNGGFTPTMALDPDSPAIGHGDNTGLRFVGYDQRGFERRMGACDIGALEENSHDRAPTITTLSSSGTPSILNDLVTITATVKRAVPFDTPLGTVQFFDGAEVQAVPLAPDGTAQFMPSALTLGKNIVKATYVPANTAFAISDTSLVQTIQEATSVTVTSAGTPSLAGQPVTFTATVTANEGSVVPQGSVHFDLANTVNSGFEVYQTTRADGSAQITAFLPVGMNVITAKFFAGSDLFQDSPDSDPVTQTILDYISTTTTLLASNNPSVVGAPVTLTATVQSASASYPATGDVYFTDVSTKSVATPLGHASLAGGTASVSVSSLSAGKHHIVATFFKQNGFLASVDSLDQTVADTTSTTLTSSSNPVNLGDRVMFTATVTSPSGVPSGSVDFLYYPTIFVKTPTDLGTVPLDSAGTAKLATSSLNVGGPLIEADFTPANPAYQPSVGTLLQHVTDKTTTTLSANIAPVVGQTFRLTAIVSGARTAGAPTGKVRFSDDEENLGDVDLVNGVATLDQTPAHAGHYNFHASYLGSGGSVTSEGSVPVTVSPDSTTTTGYLSSTDLVAGQRVIISANVAANSSALAPTGAVDFTAVEGFDLGKANLQNGVAILGIVSASVGKFGFKATYLGSADFSKSAASASTTVSRDDVTTTVALSANPATAGQPLLLAAAMIPNFPGSGTPTGTVTFLDGTTPLGTADAAYPTYQAHLQTTSLAPGTHTITAVYSGDASFTGSTSAAVTEVVVPRFQQFIGGLYLGLLGHAANPAAMAGWSSLLAHGSTPAQVVTGIEHSQEYRIKQVEDVYATLLHHPADVSDLQSSLAFLTAGGTKVQLEAIVAASPDYFQTRSGSSNTGFLAAIYLDLVGHAIDPATLSSESLQLAHGMSRSIIALAVATSRPAETRRVQGYYQMFLNHPADAAGLNRWLNVARGGINDDQVIAGIAGSPAAYAPNSLGLASTPPLVKAANSQSSMEGTPGSFDLGTFLDQNRGPWIVDIHWGDGSADTVFAVATAGAIDPTGTNSTHTFAEEGLKTVKERITDLANGQSSTGSFSVDVFDVPVRATSTTIAAVEGSAFIGTVATFTDPAGAEPNPSDGPDGSVGNHYSASIAWGDNTPATSGTIAYDAKAKDFTVSGSHTYAEEGGNLTSAFGYSVMVTISHEATSSGSDAGHDAPPPVTVPGEALVSDPAVAPTGGFQVIAYPGTDSGDQIVATFTDPAGTEPNASADPFSAVDQHYSASIDWGVPSLTGTGATGDSSTTGTITSSKSGVFSVHGRFTYAAADEGQHTINVTIHHEGAPDATAISTAIVLDRTGKPAGTGLTLDEGATRTIDDGMLFTPDDGSDGTADIVYRLTSVPTGGALQENGTTLKVGDSFSQDAIHNGKLTFADHGSDQNESFDFIVTDGPNSSEVAGSFNIRVNDVPPPLPSSVAVTVPQGGTLNIDSTLLHATDDSPADPATDLVYTMAAAPTAGTLLLGGKALVARMAFTQDDVNHKRVVYRQQGSAGHDGFRVTLTDGGSPASITVTFSVAITTPQDLPVLTVNTRLTLAGGTEASVNHNMLLATDLDAGDPPADLIYTLKALPKVGDLQLNGQVLVVGSTFTQSDIDAGLLGYQDLHSAATDTFNFTVQDGVSGGSVAGTFAIRIFMPPAFTEFAAASPYGIVAGPGGYLWFTAYGANKVIRMSTSGVVKEYPLPTPGAGPEGITIDASGNVWFAENRVSKIGRIKTDGSIQEFALTSGAANPAGMAFGPGGKVWFTCFNPNQLGQIGNIDPANGNMTIINLPGVKPEPLGITAGPDGNLWITEFGHQSVAKITPAGDIKEFAIPGADQELGGITAGPDGALWFTESIGNAIGRITTDGTFTRYSLLTTPYVPIPPTGAIFAGANTITTGADGNLYFMEYYANRIARLTPAGNLTEIALPTAASDSYGLTAGPDGNIWFGERGTGKIGRLILPVPG